MKIIFLDIDGVLNSPNFLKKMKNQGFGEHQIDPENIRSLNKLVGATKAKVVISSAWRHIWTVSELRKIFAKVGFEHVSSIVDRTPVGQSNRGLEIQEWLDLDPERAVVNPEHQGVESFVILDDNNDMTSEQQDRFVQINAQFGLTDENVDEAIAILRMRL